MARAATAASVRFLIILFIGSVFLFGFCWLLRKGGLQGGIPIPSYRHSIVECSICTP
jgi:hypothetical protein